VCAVAVLAAAGLAVPAVRHLRESPPVVAPETRTEINTAATGEPSSFALSPDGTQLVYAATVDGVSRLWLRPLASTAAQPLAGTENARYPFWSPDGRAIAFFGGGQLKRLDLGGGQPRVLAPARDGRGGTWNADSIILFTPNTASPVFRVAASGSAPERLTTLESSQTSHRFPQFLPGGRPILRARQLDLAQRRLTGELQTLTDAVALDAASTAAFSVSSTGLVAYRLAGPAQRSQLAWFDRAGQSRGVLGAPDDAALQGPRVSPDGRRVAVHRTVAGNIDIWLLDGARMSRFTFDAGIDTRPIWSPDGSRVVFASNRSRPYNLFLKNASGVGEETRIAEATRPGSSSETASDWSRDGRFILYSSQSTSGLLHLWALPLAGDRTPWPLLQTPFDDRDARLSPDGRWVAYMSNASGRFDVYVRPFTEPGAAGTGGEWLVSTAGGVYPTWRADGRDRDRHLARRHTARLGLGQPADAVHAPSRRGRAPPVVRHGGDGRRVLLRRWAVVGLHGRQQPAAGLRRGWGPDSSCHARRVPGRPLGPPTARSS
jgi:Tol biopolymer transport system component